MAEVVRDLLAIFIAVNIVASAHSHFLPSAIEDIRNVFPPSDGLQSGCDGVDGLSSVQKQWCRRHTKFMYAIGEGALLGLQECQRRFEFNRWNCNMPDSEAFRKVMRFESSETAFVQAIQSAGMTLTISRTCSSGNVTEFCECDTSAQRDTSNVGKWDWGGCGDNFEKGYEFTRQFLDETHNTSEKNNRDMMELHNNEVGRLAVKQTMKRVCKCHGLTGTCTVKICWKSLPKVNSVGKILKNHYDNAVRVGLRNDSPSRRALQPISPLPAGKLFQNQLVYLREPPNFCRVNKTLGTVGTADRECHVNTHGKDSCELLCCGNGNYVERTIVRRQCGCRFVWCCSVKCNTCLVARRTYYCERKRSQ